MLQLGPMDLRTHAAASTWKQTQLSVGTMRASQLDQSSTVQPNLHAKLLRNLHQPMHSARRPTRGWICIGFYSRLDLWRWPYKVQNDPVHGCRAEEASYYRKEADDAELRLTEARSKLV